MGGIVMLSIVVHLRDFRVKKSNCGCTSLLLKDAMTSCRGVRGVVHDCLETFEINITH